MIVVAGAGMAGLVAAARARELGAGVTLLEKGDRPGGSMLLSSGMVFRYRDFEEFRRQCPRGDVTLQRLVHERLDDALDWLESLGASVVARETGNSLTCGRRFETRGLTEALVRAAGSVRLQSPLSPSNTVLLGEEAVVLATGGFQGDRSLVERHVAPAAQLPLRANRWSTGDALRLAVARGAGLSAGMEEFYGRNMPDVRFSEAQFVPLAQLYGRRALAVLNDRGEEFHDGPVSWSENDLVQSTARQPGASAWYLLEGGTLSESIRGRTVGKMVEAARAAGGTVLAASELPFPVSRGARLAVRVRASITSTLGGLRVNEQARVLGEDGSPVEGLWACGGDAGGVSTGGYSSGLAAALVLGLAAAESAAH